MNRTHAILAAVATGTLLSTSVAFAGSVTDTFTVSGTVVDDCVIQSAGNLSFGTTIGALAAAVDASSTITLRCTNTTAYNVGLDEGTGSGATVTNRLMTGADVSPQTLGYGLYTDSGRTTNWGNTPGTDTVAGTGNGGDQTLTVYGRIPSQTAPKPDSYSDTITVTVSF